MAWAAHARPESETEIAHPVAVAELLSEQGFDDTVVEAALLHDTVEDTTLTSEQIAEYFGPEIATAVAEVTEDARIEPYTARKAEARSRVMRDRRAAAIYAADKLANTRDLLNAASRSVASASTATSRPSACSPKAVPISLFSPSSQKSWRSWSTARQRDRETASPQPER